MTRTIDPVLVDLLGLGLEIALIEMGQDEIENREFRAHVFG